MTFAQYLRIERELALGVFATNRDFIREAYKLLKPISRKRQARDLRHNWLREGLEMKRKAQTLV